MSVYGFTGRDFIWIVRFLNIKLFIFKLVIFLCDALLDEDAWIDEDLCVS